jgi:S1-C subfamily serine protease
MPDLQKMMEQLFGGKGGPGGGEMPDLQKMMEQLFGGQGPGGPGGGEAPDLQKMMEQLFGGRDRGGERPGRGPEAPEAPRSAPQSGFLGVRAAQQQGGAPGVVIDQVVEAGPAAKGGLSKGDCIVSVDGKATPNMDALKDALAGKGAGTTIQVVVERTVFADTVPVTERKTLQVTLGARQ